MNDLTPRQLAQLLPQLSDDQLSQLPHALLYAARQYVPQQLQGKISPFEHRAFAREATTENPLMSVPIAIATLGYQPWKMIAGGSRSEPSLNQLGQGLLGVREGTYNGVKNRLAGLLGGGQQK